MKHIALSIALLTCAACTTTQPKAEEHAPRGVWSYRYYPEVEVYFSETRGLYFWCDQGVWLEGTSLPFTFTSNLGPYTRIKLDTDEPYQRHDDVLRDHPRIY